MNKIKLYIVRQNETISDIATKFGVTPEEIIRYNPSLKYKRVYKGQPLNILVRENAIEDSKEEYQEVIRIRKPNLSKDQCLALTKHAYSLKDALTMRILYPKAYEDSVMELSEVTDTQIDSSLSLSETIKKVLKKLNTLILGFMDSLASKDINLLKDSIGDLRSFVDETIKEGKDDLFQTLVELWKEIVIGIAELDFSKVRTKFKEVLHYIESM